MKLEAFLDIEIQFEKGIFFHENSVINEYLQILKLTSTGDFLKFYEQMESRLVVLSDTHNHFEKGCCLILIILVSESQYNLIIREAALTRFQALADHNYIRIFEFYRTLFKAVGYAFQSLQIEALSCYTRALVLAEACNYPRGQVRALTGTGLTQQEMGHSKESKNSFKRGLVLAKSHGFERATNRLKSFLEAALTEKNTGQGMQIENLLLLETQEIVKLIRENDLLYARKRLTEAERLRRQSRISRKAYSFYIWAAVIGGLLGKKSYCLRIIDNLDDRVLKLQVLNLLKLKDFELPKKSLTQIKILESELILAQAENQAIDLGEIKNINIRALLKCLSAAEQPMTKAELFEHVFKISYDPVIHDAKLYKLIMITRREIGGDIIVNHFGAYSYNSKSYNIVG